MWVRLPQRYVFELKFGKFKAHLAVSYDRWRLSLPWGSDMMLDSLTEEEAKHEASRIIEMSLREALTEVVG